MAVKILVHGSGTKWLAGIKKTLSYMQDNGDIMCPSLVSILKGKRPAICLLRRLLRQGGRQVFCVGFHWAVFF